MVVDLNLGVAVGDCRQRGRDRDQRLGHPAHQHHGQHHHEQRSDAGCDSHVLNGVRQHALEMRHRDSHKEKSDHFPGGIHDRVVARHEALAEQRRRPLVGLAAAYDRLSGVVGRELGADCAVAVLLLEVGGAADELIARLVIDEQGRVAAGIAHRAIDDRVVLELRHFGNFGAGDGPVLDRKLGVAVGFGERQAQRAQVDLDVPQRPIAELGGKRPMGRSHHQRGIDRNQKDGRDNGLGAEPQLERRQELSNGLRGHTRNPPKSRLI